MLYERWRQIAFSHSKRMALRDLSSGEDWTFGEIAARVEREPAPSRAALAHPRGISADFIFELLRAWRFKQVVCPLETDQAAPVIPRALPADIVHLKMTSATTGTARVIAFTAAQLVADAQNIVATMGLGLDSPNLGVISLAHSYGFSNLVLPLVLHGIPLHLIHSPLPELLKRANAITEKFTLPAVPALWRVWHESNAIPRNVRLAISAGAPLPVALEQSIFTARGLKVHNFYGSSECGGIAYDASSLPRTEGSCVGGPMQNVSLKVGSEGCLEVRSDAVANTYWPEPGDTLGNGVFKTSDLAEIVFGMVYLRGRVNDQINVAGRKIAPEVIETAIAAHPAIRECLVFGAPAPHGGRTEMVVACFVARGEVADETLRQFALEKLPAWQVPREWWRVDSLLPNKRGKLSRAEWRRAYLSRADTL
ncbi:MAG TPA: fatty acid--CoA ligase family protein [Verrucomicrobiae bacterium]|nr:fatty acid--CoA ligase family protein [Verrucomicrobiae bacterium]